MTYHNDVTFKANETQTIADLPEDSGDPIGYVLGSWVTVGLDYVSTEVMESLWRLDYIGTGVIYNLENQLIIKENA